MHKINWRGDNCKNYYKDRISPHTHKQYTPLAIFNHITAGTRQSVFWWFTSPNNPNASAHYVVARDGSIDQYVRLEDGAYAQGIAIPDGLKFAKAPIVLEQKTNPNYFGVGVEHEGYVEGHVNDDGEVEVVSYGLDGDLTEEQFYATCWLHKHIQLEINRIWGYMIPLNGHNVDGHFRVDPRRKGKCPGPKYPWGRLYSELAMADKMTLEQYEEHITYQKSLTSQLVMLYAFVTRTNDLKNKLTGPYAAEAERKLLLLLPIMSEIGGDTTAKGIADRMMDLYNTAKTDGKWDEEAVRKLLIVVNFAKDVGLVA